MRWVERLDREMLISILLVDKGFVNLNYPLPLGSFEPILR